MRVNDVQLFHSPWLYNRLLYRQPVIRKLFKERLCILGSYVAGSIFSDMALLAYPKMDFSTVATDDSVIVEPAQVLETQAVGIKIHRFLQIQ